ncbi:uncharacterized protein EDB93DRAFT_759598 [Suillus bovinus]|uniref:uncharacterized protein n=1 Tax=Suillus bovinus TaxID=48563 RepID=UPI001B860050|nr:uncharacterized protein EDB93DRAFT_759598 [Suillus bovinus]KAG2137596.1 hypothetical protein EDB93DRAFT_759598 [Suillus bovinus]
MESPMETCASAPFDHAKADVILRSADGVEFRVFMLFLSLASPFFETLFDLPQASDEASDQEMKDGLAVITVSEDSKTLDSFLRFCYPSTMAEDPCLEDLTEVLPVLAAARKYSLDLIERKVCQALANPKVLETEPLRCFAIARNARLKHETITAARHNLRKPLIPALFPEINLISASDFLALLTYHKKCIVAVQALLKDLRWMTSNYGSLDGCGWLFNRPSPSPSPSRHSYSHHERDQYCCGQGTDARFFPWNTAPLAWWTTYMQEVYELLQDRPSGDTVRAAADRTIQKVRSADCAACSGRVKECMTEFSNLFALKVDEAVAPIELEMEF